MFEVIKVNISEADAKELYTNDYMILLVEDSDTDDWVGNLIFVGTEQDRHEFYLKHRCPSGYLFFILKGIMLERFDSGSVQTVTPLRLKEVEYAI